MYAEKFGKANECIEVIMNYYFELNKDISSHKVLIEIGQKIGLSKIDELFKGNEYVKEVNADLKRAKGLGVTGVPTFVVNDNYKQKSSGAHGADFWLSMFKELGIGKL